MQKCPKCLAEQNNVNSSTCFYCGADMSKSNEISSKDSNNDNSFDKDEYIPEKHISLPDSDDLGVETTADLMESEAQQLSDNESLEDTNPLNQSSYKDLEQTEVQKSINKPLDIKKLSENEIKEIEKNLYKSDNYINNREKSDIMKKIGSISSEKPEPFANTPIEPHKIDDKNRIKSKKADTDKVKADLPKPQIAKKGQGLAYFYNNYIQLQGSQKLHSEDILSINNREYILKPKKLNNNVALYSVVGLLVLVVTILGSFLAGNSNFCNGRVIGVILDENNTPYLEGATVLFSELGIKSNSDAQGLFSVSDIPAGSHKIEYFINDEKIGSDYITIADDNNSFITLKPSVKSYTQKDEPIKLLAQTAAAVEKSEIVQPKKETPKKKTIKKPKKTSKKKTIAKKSTKKKVSSGYGKLALNANVEGAKIKVDGSVLGAGNLTYSKIKSGKHSYTVSLDGYEAVSGTFIIKKGKTKKISPTLVPLTQAKKEETYKESDYFYSAKNAFGQGDYVTAAADYNKAIEVSPNNVKAYFGLAESYSKQKKWELAYDNYVRAAEIHRFKGRNNDAISCYNKAIKVKEKDVIAFLGRGDIYLDAGEYRAAFGDFDKVVKIDKRNFAGYYGLGEASFKLLRFSKAIKYFKDARSLNSNNPLVHQYLTLSYMFEHDRKNTKKSFEKFNEYASENEKNKFKKNSQYSAVIKYID